MYCSILSCGHVRCGFAGNVFFLLNYLLEKCGFVFFCDFYYGSFDYSSWCIGGLKHHFLMTYTSINNCSKVVCMRNLLYLYFLHVLSAFHFHSFQNKTSFLCLCYIHEITSKKHNRYIWRRHGSWKNIYKGICLKNKSTRTQNTGLNYCLAWIISSPSIFSLLYVAKMTTHF